MQILFKDYTDLVVKAYEEKRDANLLSQLLVRPTTANIRKECLYVYNERIKKGEREEENTLRAFFGVPPAGKNFGYVIERYHADRFRPLQSIIKREIKNPAEVNVELLAWLIDFKPRPLANAQKISGNTIEAIAPVSPITDQEETNMGEVKEISPGTNTPNMESSLQEERHKISAKGNLYAGNLPVKKLKGNSWNSRLRTTAVIILMIAVIFGGVFIIGEEKKDKQIVMGNPGNGCMYWSGDHYERVGCNEDPKGRFIIPVNKENKLRRITRVDTITEWSIGKIYYIKDGPLKFYTDSGNYPEDVNRSLKVLSRHMFDKYLRNKEISPGTGVALTNE